MPVVGTLPLWVDYNLPFVTGTKRDACKAIQKALEALDNVEGIIAYLELERSLLGL